SIEEPGARLSRHAEERGRVGGCRGSWQAQGMSQPVRRPATYQDVLDAPEHLVAELIGGELHTHPRPAPPHATAASVRGMDLGGPFHRGRGGPGGWWILYE